MPIADLRNKDYEPLEWEDRVVDDVTGEVLVEGTPANEVNFNNIEAGILRALYDLGITNAQTMKTVADIVKELDKNKKQRFLQGQATITSSGESYFRDSEAYVLVSLPSDSYAQLNAPDYDVQLSILSADDIGAVGELIVYDKTQNGFKIKMTGSATSVTFMWMLLNPSII